MIILICLYLFFIFINSAYYLDPLDPQHFCILDHDLISNKLLTLNGVLSFNLKISETFVKKKCAWPGYGSIFSSKRIQDADLHRN